MNLEFIKLSKLFLNDPENCELNSVVTKWDEIEQRAMFSMGQFESSSIDFEIMKCHATSTATFVSAIL